MRERLTNATAWGRVAAPRLNKAALDHVIYATVGFFLHYHAWPKNITGIVKGPVAVRGLFIKGSRTQMGWTTQLTWSASTIEQRRFGLRLLHQVPAITNRAFRRMGP